MSESKYQFRMPIGDWSDDGHGECNEYIIGSNKPVEEVREAHFKIEEATGIDIHKIANDYMNSYMTKEQYDILQQLGLELEYLMQGNEDDEESYVSLDPEAMKDVWMFLLQKADPELELVDAEENRLPMLPFYGFDDQKRHISFVGYGTLGD
jgi:hypothetical protein